MSLPFPPEIVALALLAYLLAGTVKGTVGIGLPTASVALLSQAIEPKTAIALVVVPSIAANVWQVWRSGDALGALRRYLPFILCLCCVIGVVSALVTARLAPETLMAALGCVVILFSVSNLAWRPPALPDRFDRAAQVTLGTVSGVIGGLTSIWAPTMVAYLLARRVPKDEFVRATGVMILLGNLPLGFGFAYSGMLTAETAVFSVLLILPALAGFALGERLRRLLDADRFRTVVLLFFLLVGLNLLRRALF
ncbi:MAG: sulfite exporter TauE/SafE family protein [Pseudomonadota bacterium]